MSDYIELHVCEQPQIELEVKEQIVIGGGGIIPTGTKTINVTENGTKTEDVAQYANAQIITNVPNSYSAGDEGKVVENGALVSQESAEYTSNGTYNTTKISSVEVSVSGSGPSGTKQISISQNGTTTEDVAAYASAEISVSVPTGPAKTSDDLTVSGPTVTAPAGLYSSAASKSVASGTAGTPSATKGEVSNHSIKVTPSVTNTTGYITGGTKTGTAVSVSASELVSGSETKTENGTYDVTNLAELVVNVSGGGTTEPEPLDVDFVDYDGTLLYTYTKADFLALDSLPANPSHAGLVAQGWNWTLADAKTYVTAHGTLVIGQSYKTDDDKTRFYISIPDDGSYPDFSIIFFVETGYDAVISWGDGNTDTVAGRATYTEKNHIYSGGGDYLIEIACEGELQIGCRGTNVSSFANGHQYDYRGTYLKKVELSNNVVRIHKGAFGYATALESVAIPTSVTNMRDDTEIATFDRTYSLGGIVIPSGCEFWVNGPFQYSGVKYVSMPKVEFAISANNSNPFLNYCWNIRKFTMPDGVSSTYTLNLSRGCMAITKFVAFGNYTTLGGAYFCDCMSLPRLDIPPTVTSIAANAFNGNRGVREYHFYSTTPPTLSNTNAFSNQHGRGFAIYVPYSADHSILNAYKTATNWSTYASSIQEEPT